MCETFIILYIKNPAVYAGFFITYYSADVTGAEKKVFHA